MAHSDWYPEWRHDAFHQLQGKNARLSDEFKLGTWPRYDYDLEAGTLVFSEAGVIKVVAEIQVSGSTSAKAGNWLWAWANAHWPSALVTDAALVRAFGEQHDIEELKQDFVIDDDLNFLGWELTAAMVRICDALGAYRSPREEGGGLFLVYTSMRWAS
jgi:hypothetical protein